MKKRYGTGISNNVSTVEKASPQAMLADTVPRSRSALDRGTDYASVTEQRKRPVGSKANRGMSGYSKGSDDRRGYRSTRWGSSGISEER